MNEQTIAEIVRELSGALVGRAWGKVFLLSRASLAADFRTGGGRYLFISVEPNQPRLYLVERTVRELEKASLPPTHFVLTLRKALGGAILSAVSKDEGDRVVRFRFEAADALGETRARTLVAQLTGRAANLFLLDEKGRVLDRMRPSKGAGQEVGEVYEPPARQAATQPATQTTEHAAARTTEQTSPHKRPVIRQPLDLGEFASVSAAADDFYRRAERERAFDSRAAAAVAKLQAGDHEAAQARLQPRARPRGPRRRRRPQARGRPPARQPRQRRAERRHRPPHRLLRRRRARRRA